MEVLHYEFKGMLYDEWELNRTYVTGAHTIREAEIVNYCDLSGNTNPLYTNDLFAKDTPSGLKVVPEGLLFILANGVDTATLWVDGSHIGLLDQQLSFLKPVYVGDTIYVTKTPVEMRLSRKPGRGIITFRVCVYNQDDEMVADGKWVILMATDKEHME